MKHLCHQDRTHLSALREQTVEALSHHFDSRSKVALLGVPRHGNLGDSLILAGTRNYLRGLGARIVYEADYLTYSRDQVARLDRDCIIAFLGGGNLGDLYPLEEEFRLAVMREFPDRSFVILPQSISFRDPENEKISADVYRSCLNLTLMVRDTQALAAAVRVFRDVETELVPDLALGWSPRSTKKDPAKFTIVARADQETPPEDRGHLVHDWQYDRVNRRLWSLSARVGLKARHSKLYGSLVQRLVVAPTSGMLHHLNMRAAEKIGAESSFLVTNRLHAHILGCLTGTPHLVSDNTTGKVRAIFQDYTGKFTTAHWSPSVAESLRVSSTCA